MTFRVGTCRHRSTLSTFPCIAESITGVRPAASVQVANWRGRERGREGGGFMCVCVCVCV